MPTELKVLGLLWVLVALARGRIPGRAGSQKPGSNPDIGRGQAVTIAPPRLWTSLGVQDTSKKKGQNEGKGYCCSIKKGGKGKHLDMYGRLT